MATGGPDTTATTNGSLKRSANDVDSGESEDENEECPLTDEQARAACKEFASLTNTDTALGMMFLQQNQWQLDRAVAAYLDLSLTDDKNKDEEEEEGEAARGMRPVSLDDLAPYLHLTQSDDQGLTHETKRAKVASEAEATATKEESKPRRFKLLSWNIDGLDERNLEARTRAVVDVIKREQPDAVLLQEVILPTLQLIRQLLPQYVATAGSNTASYFVAILTLQETMHVNGVEIVPYPNTGMGRNLLIVHANYRDSLEIDLMTSHHESGVEAADERIQQIKVCFQRMINVEHQRAVVFGGDLNMREKELGKAGNIPKTIEDLWISTGKRKEASYTWDMNRNTNLNFSDQGFKPRARFDRLYFRPPVAPLSSPIALKPVYFELEGLEKVASCQRFPSDHWAVQAYFDVLPTTK